MSAKVVEAISRAVQRQPTGQRCLPFQGERNIQGKREMIIIVGMGRRGQGQCPGWGSKDRGAEPDESQASSSSPPGIQSHSKEQLDKALNLFCGLTKTSEGESHFQCVLPS